MIDENFQIERRIMSENVAKMTENMMKIVKLAGSGSKTAMRNAGIRFEESQKPEGERICYDPYAFDDFIKKSIDDGLEQLVILGAHRGKYRQVGMQPDIICPCGG